MAENEQNEQVQNIQNEQIHNQAKAAKTDTIIDLVKAAVISLIFAFIGFQIGKEDGQGLMFAYMLAGFPWGWKLISKIMDSGFMFITALADKFLIALFIKAVLGALIGAIVWPFIIGYKIYQVVKAHNYEKSVR